MATIEYNLYYDEEFVGTYTTQQLAEKFGVCRSQISQIWEKSEEGKFYKKHWQLHKIHKEKVYMTNSDKKLFEEWDNFCEPYRNKNKK